MIKAKTWTRNHASYDDTSLFGAKANLQIKQKNRRRKWDENLNPIRVKLDCALPRYEQEASAKLEFTCETKL